MDITTMFMVFTVILQISLLVVFLTYCKNEYDRCEKTIKYCEARKLTL